MKESKLFTNLFALILALVFFAVPLVFAPFTSEFYDLNKQLLVYITIVITLGIWLLYFVRTRHVRLKVGPFDIPIILFAAATIASLIFNSPNKVEALATPGGAGSIILLTIWYFLVINLAEAAFVEVILISFLVGAGLLGALASAQFGGFGLNLLFPKVAWLAAKEWNPTGSPLTLVIFLATLLPAGVLTFTKNLQSYNHGSQKELPKLVITTIVLIGIVVGLGVTTYSLFTTNKPILLPFTAAWSVAIEAAKNAKTAFLGVGMINYLSAFTIGRPTSFNNLPIWNVRFGVGFDWYLQLLTEAGILGLATYLFIIARVVGKVKPYLLRLQEISTAQRLLLLALATALGAGFLLQLVLPSNFLQLFVIFSLLGLLAVMLPHKEYTENSQILPYAISLIMLVFFSLASFGVYKVYAAEYFYKKAIDAAIANRGVDTYNLQVTALSHNPYLDRYHIFHSQTNLALANSLALKKDLTEQDRSNITQLIVQSINEAKAAVAANPTNVVNWENLAGIYRALISFANGADSWTLASYQQAISLDPFNPALRLNLGGVFYAAGNYDLAIQNFATAINLKPDWANAHYNLAVAFREKKDWNNAAQQMQLALALVPDNSPDRQKAQNELEEIKKNIPGTPRATTNGSQLTPPTKPSPVISPPLTLPTGAAPEVNIGQSKEATAPSRPRTRISVTPTVAVPTPSF